MHLTGAATRRGSLAAVATGDLASGLQLAELLPQLCRQRDVADEELRALVDETADVGGTSGDVFRLRLAQRTLTGRALLELPPEQAVDTAVRLLFVLSPVRQLSLWEADEAGTPRCSAHKGPFPSKRTAALAGQVLDGSLSRHSTGLLVGVAVAGREHPGAALMARPNRDGRARCDGLLTEIVPLMGGLLERKWLDERAARSERILTDASERRLSRLAFDLHDGALQHVAAITGDLAMLRRRLQKILPHEKPRRKILGCVDDLDARTRAVDAELRDLCRSLESPAGPGEPFTCLLRKEVEAFRRCTEIRSDVEIEGDFDDLTDSQCIALWRIIQESLANVREHSGASEVRIRAVAEDDKLHVDVTDDGSGFDVPETLLAAARRGRLGLVGVSERVRLLNGRSDVRSVPGGPTTVSVTLPRWRPET
jgi:signal transduction histidine kinase